MYQPPRDRNRITSRSVPRVGGGGVVNWLGGGGGGEGDARHQRSDDIEGSGGMLLQILFFTNLIEYGVSLCILKYKSLSLYKFVETMCWWHAVVGCRGVGSGVGRGGGRPTPSRPPPLVRA